MPSSSNNSEWMIVGAAMRCGRRRVITRLQSRMTMHPTQVLEQALALVLVLALVQVQVVVLAPVLALVQVQVLVQVQLP